MRHKRKDALKDADLVILAGAVCDFRLSYGRSLPKKGKIVCVNRDKEKMLLVRTIILHTLLQQNVWPIQVSVTRMQTNSGDQHEQFRVTLVTSSRNLLKNFGTINRM